MNVENNMRSEIYSYFLILRNKKQIENFND